jgi:excinuclease UvrABC nuclease subunit
MPVDKSALPRLSTRPGVYLFKDDRGRVLYVGKAKSLRPRVRSYFQRSADLSAKNRELMRHVEGSTRSWSDPRPRRSSWKRT